MDRCYYVYILTNKYNTVLYIGVTNDLIRRVYEHKQGLCAGFTKKYNVSKLVYYEIYEYVNDAIYREKTLKGKTRQKKIDLINIGTSRWDDLYSTVL